MFLFATIIASIVRLFRLNDEYAIARYYVVMFNWAIFHVNQKIKAPRYYIGCILFDPHYFYMCVCNAARCWAADNALPLS